MDVVVVCVARHASEIRTRDDIPTVILAIFGADIILAMVSDENFPPRLSVSQ